MEQLISENESHKFEVHRLKDNKAELKKTVSLLETSEAEKVRAIEDLMNIKEDLKIQNKVWYYLSNSDAEDSICNYRLCLLCSRWGCRLCSLCVADTIFSVGVT